MTKSSTTPAAQPMAVEAPKRARFQAGKMVSDMLPMILVIGGFIIIWELACRYFEVGVYLLPKPTEIAFSIYENAGFLFNHMLYTLGATVAGFALAVAIGVALAIAIVYSPIVEKALFTALVAFNAVPKIAIAPLFIIWVGTDIESKVLMAFLIAIFPIVVDSVLGLRSVDPAQIDLVRTYRSSHLKLFWKIRFPNALPGIFAGMKVGISLALIGTIVGEFVGASRGLGFVVLQAQGLYQTPLVFAAITLLSILGVILYNAIDMAERALLPWHVSHRSASAEKARK